MRLYYSNVDCRSPSPPTQVKVPLCSNRERGEPCVAAAEVEGAACVSNRDACVSECSFVARGGGATTGGAVMWLMITRWHRKPDATCARPCETRSDLFNSASGKLNSMRRREVHKVSLQLEKICTIAMDE